MSRRWILGCLHLLKFSFTVVMAVFFSSLSLYLHERLHYPVDMTFAISGLFLACSYGLPVIGGWLLERYIGTGAFWISGLTCCLLGSLLMQVHELFLFALACYVTGNMATKLCINVLLMEQFSAEEIAARKRAFTLNYTAMNIGFVVGYILTGLVYQAHLFHLLFAFISGVLSLALVGIIYLMRVKLREKLWQWQAPVSFAGLTFLVYLALRFAAVSSDVLLLLLFVLLFLAFIWGIYQSSAEDYVGWWQFGFYLLLGLGFWTVYLLTPIALMLLVSEQSVLQLGRIHFPPQWLEVFGPITVVITGLISTRLIQRYETSRGVSLSNRFYYMMGLSVLCGGVLLLSFGFASTPTHQPFDFDWILVYLVATSVAEVFIGPVMYALVGELIPPSGHTNMMGVSILHMGIASLLASKLSTAYIKPILGNVRPFAGDAHELARFFLLVAIALIAAIMLVYVDPTRRRQRIPYA